MISPKNFLTTLLIIAISFFSFNPLLKQGYIPMHDDMQPIRLLELDKCLKDGQIPCRWTPDLGFGYGYPQFIFYPPLPYYVMEIFHISGFSILNSIKIGFVLSFVLSGFAMFVLGRSLWGTFGGLVSTAFYVYAPYRASDVYSRGAVGEFWATIFLPLILWAILKIIQKSSPKKYIIYLSLSVCGLLLTHNLTSISFAPIAAAWTIMLLFYYKSFNKIPKIIFGLFIGFLLSAFFTVPLVFEKQFVHLDSMISGYFNYLAHFVSLGQLFFRGHWGYGSSELGSYDDLSFSIGTLHWLTIVISSIFVILRSHSYKKNFSILIFLFSLITFIFSIFLTHQRSSFIWKVFDFLKYFQFPWRFLVITMLSTSITAGFLLSLIKKKFQPFYAALLIILVILTNAYFFRPQSYLQITDSEKFTGKNWENQQTASIYDYLPISAKSPPASRAPDSPIILEGQVDIKSYQRGTNWQQSTVDVSSQQSLIQMPFFYFPGLKVFIDNQEIGFSYQNDLGLPTFSVPKGSHQIFLKLTRTLDQTAGDLLSLLGIIIITAYLCFF